MLGSHYNRRIPAAFHSVDSLFVFLCAILKRKDKPYRVTRINVILPVILCGCEIWSTELREESEKFFGEESAEENILI